MIKTSILVVNGGKDPESGKWLSLFTKKLYEFTDIDKFNLVVWNNNVDDENVKRLKNKYQFDLLEPLTNDRMFHPHAVPLQRLYNYTVKKHSPDIIILMDSDAFPIKKGWFEELTGAIESGKYILAGAWRDEFKNEISPYIHASCICFPTSFIEENNLRLDYYGYNTETKKNDTLSSLTDKAIENGYDLYRLTRSNKNNFHRLMGGIYGDLIYHHGAGSRSEISFWDEGKDQETRRLNAKINQYSSYLLFSNFNCYVGWLKGEHHIENLEALVPSGESGPENVEKEKKRPRLLYRIKERIVRELPARSEKTTPEEALHYDYMKGRPTEEELALLGKPLGWEFSFPDVVGLGVPKAGTSWWFDNLLTHPHIVPHRFYDDNRETSKELHYFAHIGHKLIDDNLKNTYKKCFLKQPGVLCAEFSTIYLHNFCYLNNLFNTVGEGTKFVIILRNPVDRYISHLNHVMFNRTRRLKLKDLEKREFFCKYSATPEASYYSLYSDQIEYVLSRVGRDRLFVDTYENLLKSPENSYRNFIDFLELQQYYIPDYYQEIDYRKPKNKQKYVIQKPEQKEKEIIFENFRADVARLKVMLPDLDLSDWDL